MYRQYIDIENQVHKIEIIPKIELCNALVSDYMRESVCYNIYIVVGSPIRVSLMSRVGINTPSLNSHHVLVDYY